MATAHGEEFSRSIKYGYDGSMREEKSYGVGLAIIHCNVEGSLSGSGGLFVEVFTDAVATGRASPSAGSVSNAEFAGPLAPISGRLQDLGPPAMASGKDFCSPTTTAPNPVGVGSNILTAANEGTRA